MNKSQVHVSLPEFKETWYEKACQFEYCLDNVENKMAVQSMIKGMCAFWHSNRLSYLQLDTYERHKDLFELRDDLSKALAKLRSYSLTCRY